MTAFGAKDRCKTCGWAIVYERRLAYPDGTILYPERWRHIALDLLDSDHMPVPGGVRPGKTAVGPTGVGTPRPAADLPRLSSDNLNVEHGDLVSIGLRHGPRDLHRYELGDDL